MMSSEQRQLLDALAQRLVDLDGRVYLAQQAYAGQSPDQPHLLEMQLCVRQMIQQLQSILSTECAGTGPAA